VILEKLEQPRDQIRAAIFSVFCMKNPAGNPLDTPTKLVVRVLTDLIARDRFKTYPDLAEALKVRCARLKIPYHAGLIAEALDQVERGGRRPVVESRYTPARYRVETVETFDLSRHEAAARLSYIRQHLVRAIAKLNEHREAL
jgi:hypothetical protein